MNIKKYTTGIAIIALLAIIISVLAMSGCAISDKGTYSAVADFSQASVNASSSESVVYESCGLYTKTFNNESGTVSYTMSVPNSIPASGPVLRVSPDWLDDEAVRNITRAIFGDTEIYESPDPSSKAVTDLLCRGETSSLVESDLVFKDEVDSGEEGAQRSLNAVACVNGNPYRISASIRDADNYSLNTYWAFIDDGYICNAAMRSAPDDDQINAAVQEAERILSDAELDNWVIYSARTEEFYRGDSGKIYKIVIRAVPSYLGVNALYHQQYWNIRTGDSDCYYEAITIEFGSDNELLLFELEAPMEVTGVVSESAELISFDGFSSYVEAGLSARSADYYKRYSNISADIYTADVNVTGIEYGLTRVADKSSPGGYTYVPSAVVMGTVDLEYTLEITGSGDKPNYDAGPHQLLVINLLDGSIIDVSNGYLY